jgi:hypothetical protein
MWRNKNLIRRMRSGDCPALGFQRRSAVALNDRYLREQGVAEL